MRTISISDEDENLISDALTSLWHHGPARRPEIKRLCLSSGLLLEGDGPDEDD
jgi:hypothetical protein